MAASLDRDEGELVKVVVILALLLLLFLAYEAWQGGSGLSEALSSLIQKFQSAWASFIAALNSEPFAGNLTGTATGFGDQSGGGCAAGLCTGTSEGVETSPSADGVLLSDYLPTTQQ